MVQWQGRMGETRLRGVQNFTQKNEFEIEKLSYQINLDPDQFHEFSFILVLAFNAQMHVHFHGALIHSTTRAVTARSTLRRSISLAGNRVREEIGEEISQDMTYGGRLSKTRRANRHASVGTFSNITVKCIWEDSKIIPVYSGKHYKG